MRSRARPPVPITPMRTRSFAPRADAGAGRHPVRRAVVAPMEVPRKRRLPEWILSVMLWLLRARSPLQHEEGDRLAGQREGHGSPATFDAHAGGAVQLGELPGGLELRVLVLAGCDGRAHPLPGGERVAVVLVDAVVPEARLTARRRQAAHRELDRGIGAGQVGVGV